MHRLNVFIFLPILTLVLTTSACQPARKALNLATKVEIEFVAEENINPDYDERPSPVVVRAFELLDDRQFGREDFLNLYENADDRLGRDLLDTTILKELAPEETRTEVLELTTEVKYIGLLAEFIQYQDAEAILLLPITEHKKNKFVVSIDSTSIEIKTK